MEFLKLQKKLDHIGMFGKTVEDVALLAKVLIKKDKFDSATVDYSADGLLEETKKGPLFEPKFIFYKTDYWKNVEKKSREAFEYFIKSFKNNIEIFDAPSYFKDIHKYHQLFMKQIWQIILDYIIKSIKKNYLNLCRMRL